MTYEININGVKRDLPLCKVADDLYIAAFDMFGDNDIVYTAAVELAYIINEKGIDYDIIVTPEAKAIPLAYEMSSNVAWTHPYIVVRKKVKAYMEDPVSVTVKSITTFDTQTLVLDKKYCDMIKGKKVLIVDDVISTGESLRAVEELVNKCGGTVTGRAAVLAEGKAAERDDIIFLDTIPLFHADGTIYN